LNNDAQNTLGKTREHAYHEYPLQAIALGRFRGSTFKGSEATNEQNKTDVKWHSRRPITP
jgi:hypothetical protein